jgi:hypothetical protein
MVVIIDTTKYFRAGESMKGGRRVDFSEDIGRQTRGSKLGPIPASAQHYSWKTDLDDQCVGAERELLERIK